MTTKGIVATIATSETISSVQIAEITGKRHDHVMRDIRNLVEQLDEIDAPNFGLVDYRDAKGEIRPMYNLTKKGSLCLASGYNANLRMKIINRWEELELQAQQADIPSYQIENKVQRAEKWIEEQKQLELTEAKLEQVTEIASKNFGNTIAVSKRYTEIIDEYKVENENLKDELDYVNVKWAKSRKINRRRKEKIENLEAEIERLTPKKQNFDRDDWREKYVDGNYCL